MNVSLVVLSKFVFFVLPCLIFLPQNMCGERIYISRGFNGKHAIYLSPFYYVSPFPAVALTIERTRSIVNT